MTDQEAYETVCRHLLTQRQKSRAEVGGDVVCAYRGEDGRKCAIGCLISDDQYRPDMECNTVRGLVESHGLVLCPSTALLRDLQVLHDTMPVDRWRRELELLGRRFGLDAAVLQEFPC